MSSDDRDSGRCTPSAPHDSTRAACPTASTKVSTLPSCMYGAVTATLRSDGVRNSPRVAASPLEGACAANSRALRSLWRPNWLYGLARHSARPCSRPASGRPAATTRTRLNGMKRTVTEVGPRMAACALTLANKQLGAASRRCWVLLIRLTGPACQRVAKLIERRPSGRESLDKRSDRLRCVDHHTLVGMRRWRSAEAASVATRQAITNAHHMRHAGGIRAELA